MLAGGVQQSLKLRRTHHKKKSVTNMTLTLVKSVVQLKNSCLLPKEFRVFSGVSIPLISVQNSDKAFNLSKLESTLINLQTLYCLN